MAKTKNEKAPKKAAKPVVIETPAQRLSGIIKTCRNIMRKDKGMNGDGDRLPMLTWIMFLKFLDDNENLQEINAKLEGKKYKSAIAEPYRWRDWAKDKNLTGDDLLAFVNNEKVKLSDGKERTGLFYYLRALQSETGAERKDVIATVFKGVTNRMINGYLLRDIINKIDEIHFTSNEELNSLSHLYESILKEMRDASGDAGEFYTPRPVVRFMVEMLDPKIGETVLDPACGTGGFLVESFEHLKKQAKTVEHKKLLQEKAIIGGEAKPLPYLLAQMNLLLHGLNYPNIDSGNSLRVPLKDIGDNQRVDIVLANPPFGGEEEKGILNNFPDDKQTTETALLFLQLIMRKLKRKKPTQEGGRAAIVVPNSALLATGVSGRIIKQLLIDFNVHTIVRLGDGVFAPYTDIPSNLIFFDTEKKTDKIWFYEICVPEEKKKYSKSKPLRIEEFDNLKSWWGKRKENENAWSVKVSDVINESGKGAISINLDLKNPNKKDLYIGLNAIEISNDIHYQISENLKLIKEIREEINLSIDAPKEALYNAIEENTDEVIVDPAKSYEFAGVYGFGKGIFKRQFLEGNNTSYKVFHRLHENDLVISKVKGWEGAIALVPKEFEGLFLSPQYPTFKAKDGINIKYISEYCKHPKVWQDLLNKSKGIGARRNSISVPTFLSLEIPLPDIAIQNKIVDALEKLTQLKENQIKLYKKIEFLTPAILENVFQFETPPKNISKNTETFAHSDDMELAMILALMESKLGNTYGEVGIQKTVFNVEAFNPTLSRKYNFVNYHYGTYSAELKNSVNANPFLGKKVIKGNEVFTISPSHKKTVLNAISDKSNQGFVMAVNSVLDLYSSPFIGKHTDKIELLNTVTKLIMDLQTSDVNTIYEGMKKWTIKQQGFNTKADKFNITDTKKTIELLKSNGLMENLVKKG